MCNLFVEDADFQRVPLVVVHFVEDFHVKDGRDNGSEADHRKGDQLCHGDHGSE